MSINVDAKKMRRYVVSVNVEVDSVRFLQPATLTNTICCTS